MIPVERPAADRAGAYGMTPVLVDGNDVSAVRAGVGEAVDRARGGGGPTLIEAETYRLTGHSVADPAKYRSADEVAAWAERDPLLRQAAVLSAAGMPDAELDALAERLKREVDELAAEALAAPEPEPASAWTDMWSDGSAAWRN